MHLIPTYYLISPFLLMSKNIYHIIKSITVAYPLNGPVLVHLRTLERMKINTHQLFSKANSSYLKKEKEISW